MKKTILLLFTIFSVGILKSQSERFIDIDVQDTIQTKATTISYLVIINELYEDYNMESNSNHKKSISAKEIKSIIKKLEIKVCNNSNENYTIDNSNPELNSENYFNLEFQNESELKKFYNRIKEYENIYAVISNVSNSRMEDFEVKLVEKIIKKAEEKAKKIAILMDKQITGIGQISELSITHEGLETWNLNQSIGWTAYPPLSKLLNISIDNQYSKVICGKRLRIRFELE